MKKSVSIPDELVMQVFDHMYVKTARDPKHATSFSEVVKQALELFFQTKKTEVCK